jgi:hypothetical protein
LADTEVAGTLLEKRVLKQNGERESPGGKKKKDKKSF